MVPFQRHKDSTACDESDLVGESSTLQTTAFSNCVLGEEKEEMRYRISSDTDEVDIMFPDVFKQEQVSPQQPTKGFPIPEGT